ncbi:hypothetical protein [Caldimonas sp. KR1-144]|uniref:hypothetical protein n=1 Tax=Caldimonas sp. KR1-144 TaxID=3400911 RepID=UPI003C0959BF
MDRRCALRGLALLAAWGLSGALHAGAAPPAVAGRVSWLAGRTTLQAADGVREPARPNLPVAAGDTLVTDGYARAEVWIGSTALRLDAASTLRVSALDDTRRAFALDAGSLALRVDDDADAHRSAIETALGRFVPQQSGAWRVDLRHDGIDATALRGGLRFEGFGTRVTVLGGQRAHLRREGAGLRITFDAAPRDDFAAFVDARDRDAAGLHATGDVERRPLAAKR